MYRCGSRRAIYPTKEIALKHGYRIYGKGKFRVYKVKYGWSIRKLNLDVEIIENSLVIPKYIKKYFD